MKWEKVLLEENRTTKAVGRTHFQERAKKKRNIFFPSSSVDTRMSHDFFSFFLGPFFLSGMKVAKGHCEIKEGPPFTVD